MQATEVWRQFQALPAPAQRQVADFIAFLRTRFPRQVPEELPPLEEEPFVGLWADREDLQDSTEWVRQVREQEWR